MADNLPAPESRVESYLAKAAGEDVTIPEEPLSRLEQYLEAIAEGGGGGGGTTYTAGDGITIADDTISVDLAQATGSSTTKVMSQKATTDFVNGLIKAGSAPTTSTEGTVGQLYEDTTNGKLYQCTAIVAGTDPDPDTYTWTEIGAGGGDTVRELTSADYNYPVNNPVRIALWLMPTGRYIVKAGTSCQYAAGWTLPGVTTRDIYCEIYKDEATSMSFIKFVYTVDTPTRFIEFIVSPNGDIQEVNNYGGGMVYTTYNALNAGNNQDGILTPLSAYQGRVLKDLIDALTTRVSNLEGN